MFCKVAGLNLIDNAKNTNVQINGYFERKHIPVNSVKMCMILASRSKNNGLYIFICFAQLMDFHSLYKTNSVSVFKLEIMWLSQIQIWN